MKALIGTRKTAIVLRLAIVLILTGSVNRDRATARPSQSASICFVVDGQIYCIPDTRNDSSSVHAAPELRQARVSGARLEDGALAVQRPQRGEATTAGDARAV